MNQVIKRCPGCECVLRTLKDKCDWCLRTYGEVIPKIEDNFIVKSTTNRKTWDQMYKQRPEVRARIKAREDRIKALLKKDKKLPKCQNCLAVIRNKDNKCVWCVGGYGKINI